MDENQHRLQVNVCRKSVEVLLKSVKTLKITIVIQCYTQSASLLVKVCHDPSDGSILTLCHQSFCWRRREVFQTADFSLQNKTLQMLQGRSKQRADTLWNKGLRVILRISAVFGLGPRWEGKWFLSLGQRLTETNLFPLWCVDPPETESMTSVWVVSHSLRNTMENIQPEKETFCIRVSTMRPVQFQNKSPRVWGMLTCFQWQVTCSMQ